MPRTPELSLAAGAVRSSVFAQLQRHIDAYEARGGKLIPLQIGDTCWPPPTGARYGTALQGADDASLYRYGPLAGAPDLLERLGVHLRPRFPDLDPVRNVQIGCGATHALFCAARAVLDPGDHVLVAAPYWPLVPGIVHACGAIPVEVPLTTLLYADPSLDAGTPFREALTDRTSAIYLISPNNPDGKVLTVAQLEAIAEVARRHDLWVFADEVYADFAFELPHVSISSLPGMASRTITAFSFSKSHALAGARVGYVVGPEPVIAATRRVANHTVYNTPVFAQRAAAAALDAGSAWADEVRARALAARDAAVSALEGSGARFFVPDGGAYVFLDFTPILQGRPLQALLERAIERGVLLAPGEAFGASYDRWARLCYSGVDTASLLDGIARLRAAMVALSS